MAVLDTHASLNYEAPSLNLGENLGPLPSVFHWKCQSLIGKEELKTEFSTLLCQRVCLYAQFQIPMCNCNMSTLQPSIATETGQKGELIEWLSGCILCQGTKRKGLPCDLD